MSDALVPLLTGARRRRARPRSPSLRVDRLRAAHRGGRRVLLDRPGRDRSRGRVLLASPPRSPATTRTISRFGREPDEYRNAILCERPNRDWAYTLARHWLYDHADALRLESLEGSSHPTSWPSLVTKIRREERYHLLHADTVDEADRARSGRGPLEARRCAGRGVRRGAGTVRAVRPKRSRPSRRAHPGAVRRAAAAVQQTRWPTSLDELGLPTRTSPSAGARAEFVASSSGDLIARRRRDGSESGAADDRLGGRSGATPPTSRRCGTS